MMQRRVMVIDNNVDTLELFRRLLEADGHTVALVQQARQALQEAAAWKPDVVICDWLFTGDLHAVALLRALRRVLGPSVTIIFSAAAGLVDPALGATPWVGNLRELPRPFTPRALRATLATPIVSEIAPARARELIPA
jgi:CheY-like chemotaxis protein